LKALQGETFKNSWWLVEW